MFVVSFLWGQINDISADQKSTLFDAFKSAFKRHDNSSFYDSIINSEITFLKTELSEFKPSIVRRQLLKDYIIKDYEITTAGTQ